MFRKDGTSKLPQPIGILKIQPNVSDERMEEFKNKWMEAISGIHNAIKFPLISNDNECKFIPLISPKRARFLLYAKNKINERQN